MKRDREAILSVSLAAMRHVEPPLEVIMEDPRIELDESAPKEPTVDTVPETVVVPTVAFIWHS